MSHEVDDEDVQLIADALTTAGWKRETGKQGFGWKMIELQKMDEKLKAILTALVEAKLSELTTTQNPIEELSEKEAMDLFAEAAAASGIQYQVKTEVMTHDSYKLGSGTVVPLVTGHDVRISLYDMYRHQLHALINRIRQL